MESQLNVAYLGLLQLFLLFSSIVRFVVAISVMKGDSFSFVDCLQGKNGKSF